MPQEVGIRIWTSGFLQSVPLDLDLLPSGQSGACRRIICPCVSADVLTPHYPWQSSDVSVGMLPPHHGNDFGLEPPGHNKENEDDVEAMSTDSSSSSSDSD